MFICSPASLFRLSDIITDSRVIFLNPGNSTQGRRTHCCFLLFFFFNFFLTVNLLRIIVSFCHMFKILHALILLRYMWVLIILLGDVISVTMCYTNYLQIMLWLMVMVMFGYKHVKILVERLAEILVVRKTLSTANVDESEGYKNIHFQLPR